MKRPNITPGPWATKGKFVTAKGEGHVCYMRHIDTRPKDGDEANARAIAALPDLLAALEAALLRLDSHDEQSAPEALQAREALIKAGYTF